MFVFKYSDGFSRLLQTKMKEKVKNVGGVLGGVHFFDEVDGCANVELFWTISEF